MGEKWGVGGRCGGEMGWVWGGCRGEMEHRGDMGCGGQGEGVGMVIMGWGGEWGGEEKGCGHWGAVGL